MCFVLFSISKLVYVQNISLEVCWIHLRADWHVWQRSDRTGRQGNPNSAAVSLTFSSYSIIAYILFSRHACSTVCRGVHCMTSCPAAILNGEVCRECRIQKDAYHELQCDYIYFLKKWWFWYTAVDERMQKAERCLGVAKWQNHSKAGSPSSFPSCYLHCLCDFWQIHITLNLQPLC